jgi:hypothetical protein
MRYDRARSSLQRHATYFVAPAGATGRPGRLDFLAVEAARKEELEPTLRGDHAPLLQREREPPLCAAVEAMAADRGDMHIRALCGPAGV